MPQNESEPNARTTPITATPTPTVENVDTTGDATVLTLGVHGCHVSYLRDSVVRGATTAVETGETYRPRSDTLHERVVDAVAREGFRFDGYASVSITATVGETVDEFGAATFRVDAIAVETEVGE